MRLPWPIRRQPFADYKIPLQLLLIVPLILQVSGTVALVGLLSFWAGQRAVNTVTTQLQAEIAARVEQYVVDLLEIPSLVNQINVDAWVSGAFTFTGAEAEQYLTRQLRYFETISWISFGREIDGAFIGTVAQAGQDRQEPEIAVVDESTNWYTEFYSSTSQGSRDRRLRTVEEPYDARDRPWYQNAVNSEDHVWNSIYKDFGSPILYVNASQPVYAGDELLGVVAVDFSLESIGGFLDSLQVGKTGQVFLVERSGELISTSSKTPTYTKDFSDQSIDRLLAAESEDPLTQATVAFLAGQPDSVWLASQDVQQLAFRWQGDRHLVQVVPFQYGQGLDWLMVIVIPESDFMAQIRRNNRRTTALCVLAALIALASGKLTTRWIARPLARLRSASSQMSQGQWQQRVGGTRIPELEVLGQSFNQMAQQLEMAFHDLEDKNAALERSRSELVELNQAMERFVPHQFLEILAKQSIADVQLGDSAQAVMSILFADIRGFTAMSEQMTPAENFEFINAYFDYTTRPIREHHGLVDKYIGDAIMALFGGSADDAVQAAIAMLHQLAAYNQQRETQKQAPIQIGIGLNTGSLILGTVGSPTRMNTTVISDAVNLAARVESLTKRYGVALLITEHTYQALSQPEQYAIRLVDQVRVRGKQEAVKLYEVFDADPPALGRAKAQTRSLLREAIACYQRHDYEPAEILFEQCLAQAPDDGVAKVYLNRTQKQCYQFQVEILERTFEQVRPQATEMTACFYTTLFTTSPQLQKLFYHTDMKQQQTKFWQSLELIVESLRNPKLLRLSLQGLGAMHVRYGVLPEHYPMMGEALLKALASGLGQAWTEETQQAWAEAFETVSLLMIAGAAGESKY
ncbi:MAG: HAMP domain-containing protein [Spirulina sp. SIO3F2]|nr:HAMP domain-containing protein [Spirulina sp. SIO3F2]